MCIYAFIITDLDLVMMSSCCYLNDTYKFMCPLIIVYLVS